MPNHPLTRRLYLELGIRVRRRREARGKTQEQLAADVGISRSSVANIERGKQHAPIHVVLALAEALRVDMAALLPTHEDLIALVDASRDVPKLVSIGGESSLMPAEVVQLVGTILTQSSPSQRPTAGPHGRRARTRSTRDKRGD